MKKNNNSDIKHFKEYKRKKKNRNKRGIVKRILITLFIFIVVIGNLSIHQESSELKYKIYYLQEDLQKKQAKLEDLSLERENNTNLKAIEKKAIEKLDMQYPKDSQKVYIDIHN